MGMELLLGALAIGSLPFLVMCVHDFLGILVVEFWTIWVCLAAVEAARTAYDITMISCVEVAQISSIYHRYL